MAEEGLGNLVNQIRRYTEFARRVLRRWWLILPFFLMGAGGSVFYALSTTRIYQSRAMVSWKQAFQRESLGMESTSQLPENFLFHKVSRMTASDTLLLKIAKLHGLYPKMLGVVAPEVILDIMRSAITFNIVGNDSFWISFEYKDKHLAQKTTASLVQEFIQQHVLDKHRASKGTQSFMNQEASKVKKQLDDIESRLARFRSEHPELQVDPLTGLPQVNYSSSRSRQRHRYLLHKNPKLQEALRRKGKLEAQLLAQNPRSDRRMARARDDLNNARRNLTVLKQRYSSQHPDVQRAERYVQQLQQQVKAASSRHTTQASEIRRLLQNEEAMIDKFSRSERPDGVEKKPKKYKARDPSALTNTARLEKQWYSLTGDRTVIRAKYQQIQNQLQRSKLGAGMERQQAEKEFSVVDPASLPGKPIRPSRKKIVLAGTALGLMLGLGLATLMVLFDPRIYNEDDLQKACNLPVLAQIPKEP